MILTEARCELEEIIDDKLLAQKKTGQWAVGIPEIIDVRAYRLALLINYHGRSDYEQWQEQKNSNSVFKGYVSDEMRYKIYLKPRLDEIPKIVLGSWGNAEFKAGVLIGVYDVVKDNKPRRLHTLVLPADQGDIILTNHRERGLRASLNNLNPLNRGGISEIASASDIQAISRLLTLASVYHLQDEIDHKSILVPKPEIN